MWGRLIGTVITLGIIGFMFHMMNTSDTAVKNTVENSPAMKEQREMLRQAGVSPDDPEAVKKYAAQKAKEIDEYQHSADDLIKDK